MNLLDQIPCNNGSSKIMREEPLLHGSPFFIWLKYERLRKIRRKLQNWDLPQSYAKPVIWLSRLGYLTAIFAILFAMPRLLESSVLKSVIGFLGIMFIAKLLQSTFSIHSRFVNFFLANREIYLETIPAVQTKLIIFRFIRESFNPICFIWVELLIPAVLVGPFNWIEKFKLLSLSIPITLISLILNLLSFTAIMVFIWGLRKAGNLLLYLKLLIGCSLAFALPLIITLWITNLEQFISQFNDLTEYIIDMMLILGSPLICSLSTVAMLVCYALLYKLFRFRISNYQIPFFSEYHNTTYGYIEVWLIKRMPELPFFVKDYLHFKRLKILSQPFLIKIAMVICFAFGILFSLGQIKLINPVISQSAVMLILLACSQFIIFGLISYLAIDGEEYNLHLFWKIKLPLWNVIKQKLIFIVIAAIACLPFNLLLLHWFLTEITGALLLSILLLLVTVICGIIELAASAYYPNKNWETYIEIGGSNKAEVIKSIFTSVCFSFFTGFCGLYIFSESLTFWDKTTIKLVSALTGITVFSLMIFLAIQFLKKVNLQEVYIARS